VSARDDAALVVAARGARQHAYAPYSRFAVGAAVRDERGRVHVGCNVENASYGLTICAERNAVAAAVVAGALAVRAVAVVTPTRPPGSPCGACRQVLAELGDARTRVLLAGPTGKAEATTLGKLLPRAFVLRRRGSLPLARPRSPLAPPGTSAPARPATTPSLRSASAGLRSPRR
jgi:cytidine deaminase